MPAEPSAPRGRRLLVLIEGRDLVDMTDEELEVLAAEVAEQMSAAADRVRPTQLPDTTEGNQ